MVSYTDLLAQRDQLDQQIKDAIQREKAEGIAQAKAIIERYKLEVGDLFNRKSASRGASGKVAPKYRN
ncbi:MAG: H-NS histone family protein, partial [Burkholderiaceae bacterium]|nr:H-NS histone family protein [Burkholderiaceae bacterium]